MKRLLSILMALVVVLSMLPFQAFATEAGDAHVPGTESSEPQVPGETIAIELDPIEAPPADRICPEGCLLETEEEHLENNGECFFWVPCGITEGCEGPQGHGDACFTTAVYAGELSCINSYTQNADASVPESPTLTLLKSAADTRLAQEGVEFETVTLSTANHGTYTGENLTDGFLWTPEEPSVPSGYVKTVRQSGYSFTVTNTHVDSPKTGDSGTMSRRAFPAALGILGSCVCALTLMNRRKKEEQPR